MPFGLADTFRLYAMVHNGTPRELNHIPEEVFVISWSFVVCCGVHTKDVHQAGGITPPVATLVVAWPSHSVCSHPI